MELAANRMNCALSTQERAGVLGWAPALPSLKQQSTLAWGKPRGGRFAASCAWQAPFHPLQPTRPRLAPVRPAHSLEPFFWQTPAAIVQIAILQGRQRCGTDPETRHTAAHDMMSALATYSPAQIARYLDRLGLPQEQRIHDVASLDAADALAYLARLQKLHLAEIPFENLSLHYSAHHSVSLHPEQLFNKIVGDDNGRGGYCMENNALFGTLLRSLGFTLYSAGSRVYEGPGWTGWLHMVNIVTIGEAKYHVDVGFGGDGPVAPMPLERTGTVHKHIQPASVRLQWRNIPGNTDPTQRLWVFEYRRSDALDWEMKYTFTELEFQPRDFEVSNYFISTSRRTWFTRMVAVDKKILGPDGELMGKMSMAATTLKWNIRGEKTKEIEFKGEADRIEALDKYFGIKLNQAERDSIAGLPSEIK